MQQENTPKWNAADTSAYLLLRILFSDAQHYAMTYGIAINDGLGKTFTATNYVIENKEDHAMLFTATEEHTRKSFLQAIMKQCGVAVLSYTVPEMIERIVEHVGTLDEPLFIIDAAHKLKDRVLHVLVALSNSLAGKCGICIVGNDELRQRITNGVRDNKVGFDEIYKAIGRRFISLGTLGPKDIELVCRANGITDEDCIIGAKESSTLAGIEEYVNACKAKE